MTEKAKPHDSKKQDKIKHPGMMGDGTEEQNLGERGKGWLSGTHAIGTK